MSGVRQIMLNTEVNAPNFCFEVVPLRMEGEKGKLPKPVFFQNDYDCPPVATTFGWSTIDVQVCRKCGKPIVSRAAIEELTDEENAAWERGELALECDCGFKKGRKRANTRCDHDGTDGTVDCKVCGAKASDFIADAFDFIHANDGETAEDPGYF